MKRRGKKKAWKTVFKCPLTCDCDTEQWPHLSLASCGSSGTSAQLFRVVSAAGEGAEDQQATRPRDGHAHATNIRGISPLTHKSYNSKEE